MRNDKLTELLKAKEKLETEKNYRNRLIDTEIIKIDALTAAIETVENLIKSVSSTE